MQFIEVLWWLCLVIVVYTYLGYGIVLRLLVAFKRARTGKGQLQDEGSFHPEVTIIIAAYNEADFIEEKIQNTFLLEISHD